MAYVLVATPPKRLRVRPEEKVVEAPRRRSFSDRLVGFFLWFTGPFDGIGERIGEWIGGGIVSLFRTRRTRYREKHLKGGWKSTAGQFLIHHFGAGTRILVKGERALHLVQLSRPDEGVCWSLPLDAFTGIELAHWHEVLEDDAILRFHFADGSWADTGIHGPGWRSFTEQLPEHLLDPSAKKKQKTGRGRDFEEHHG